MQLLKWLFAVLVVLNVIVFANVVTQKMNGNRPQQAPAIVAVPINNGGGGVPPPAVDAPALPVAPAHAGVAAGARVINPVVAMRREQQKITAQPIPKELTKPTAIEAPSSNKNAASCTAQITLPEDAYHRLKNFINGYSNSATRSVVENKQTGVGKVQYQVLVVSNGEETLQQLQSAGINASPQGASINLGLFNDMAAANALRDKAVAAGVGGVIVSERGNTRTASTSANYTVTFVNIDNQSAQKITEVLRRYGRLQRSSCAQ